MSDGIKTLLGALVITAVVIGGILVISKSPGASLVSTAHAQTCNQSAEECYPQIDLEDQKGNIYTPESLKGDVVVINFWASWCRPCVSEIPAFARVHARYKSKGLTMLGLQRDWDGSQSLQEFRARTGLDYPVVIATYDVALDFGLPRALPTTLIYDKNGKLQYSHEGPLSESQLESIIEPLLKN